METNKKSQNSQNANTNLHDIHSKNIINSENILDDNYGKANMANKKSQNSQNSQNEIFICKPCNYETYRKNDYNKHINTDKHNNCISKLENCDKDIIKKFKCNRCNKNYFHSSSLSKHKKQCYDKEESNDNTNKLILKIFEENSNLINKLANDNTELHNIIKEIVKSGITTNSHNTNTINSHNKTFNLHMYLNETCKNAMNLSEFIETIKPTLEELELTGRVGYAKGISHIFTSRLDEVNKEEKPIQCTDGKREVLYIKENNIWNKEDEEKTLLKKAIKMITHKNLCNISEWQKMYPDCTNSESRKNDTYLKIIFNSMPGGTDEETVSNYEKIMSSVAKNTTIDK
jgi:hypothetical protein